MIRPAATADVSRIAEILIFAKRTAYRNIFNNDFVSFNEMQVVPLAKELLKCPENLKNIIVFDDGILKGMANLGESSYEGKAALELKELYIDPFFQKQGVGGMLLKHIKNICEEKGCCGITLWALEKNINALAFYNAQGFIKLNERMAQEGTQEYLTRLYLPLA